MRSTSLYVLCTLVTSSQALASDPANDIASQSGLGSLTVIGFTATEGAQLGGIPLKELPLNAHVVGAEEIERLKFVDPDELLDRIPGETQVRNLRIPNGGKSYTIPMVDGLPLESPYEGATQRLDRVNTSDIERVEVIKGPASALYGNNAFGGVVNVITKQPPEEQETQIWAEGGEFNRERYGINTGGTVGDLGYFLDANLRRMDGLREGVKNDRDQLSGKFIWDLSPDTQITTRLEHLAETVIARGDLTADQITEDPKQAGSLSSSTDFDQNSASVQLAHQLDRGELDLSVSWREKDTIGLSRFRGPQDENDTGIASKLMYRQDFDNANWIVGTELYRGDQDTLQYDRSDVTLSGTATPFSNELEIDAWFTQYQFSPLTPLTITAGLRHEQIELQSSLYTQTASFNNTAPKLGATWQFNDNLQLWASMAEGYYAPSLSNLFDLETGNPNLKQEEATNFEIGLRGSVGDFSFDSSIYQNRIENYLVTQEFIENGVEVERTTNAGQVTLRGIESVLEYAPSNQNWRLGLTHTYARNRYDSFVSSKGDFSGNDLSRSPKQHANLRFAFEPINNLVVELEGDLYSSYYSDDANSEAGRFKRDERINLRIQYTQGPWEFWLNALNLTDTLEDRSSFSRGTQKFRTVDGRTVYAGVAYNF